MFGYVKACKPELRVREYETYKAVYCTLCKRLGRAYGPLTRLTLSYDFTFLALLKLALSPDCPAFEKKRCAVNPLKKCSVCTGGAREFDFTAAAAMIMLCCKLSDNVADSGPLRAVGFRFLRLFFRGPYRRASREYPELARLVGDMMLRQAELEQAGCASIDAAAEPTAAALSGIFALCSDDAGQKRVLERLGYCLGKWIYLMDATDDLEQDLARGNYNPLARSAGLAGFVGPGGSERSRKKKKSGKSCGADGSDASETERQEKLRQARERAKANLNVCAAQAGLALELLDLKRYAPILQNIIYLGLPGVQEETVKRGQKA